MVGTMSDDKSNEPVDVVEQCIGGTGKWQYLLCLTVIPLRLTVAWLQLSFVYLAPAVNFQCANESIPRCSKDCTEYLFDKTVFSETIVTEWKLVCEKGQMANIAQMIFMFGILVGCVFFGYLADRFGRRNSIIIGTIIQGISGVGASLVPDYWSFVVLRFFMAASGGGNLIANFILIVEIFGKKWRTIIAILMQTPLMLGHSSLGLWAYFIRNWRHFQLGISLPTLLLISYYWILPESPRWLLATGRKEQAIILLQKAAKTNGLPTEEIAKNVEDHLKGVVLKPTGKVLDLLRTPAMRTRSLVLFFNWFVCGLCFYALSQMISMIGSNIFISLSLPALMQIPFCLSSIYFIERFGRKLCIYFLNSIVPLCLLGIWFLPNDYVIVSALLGGTAFVSISLSFSTVYIYTGELFPTVVRNIGAGISSTFSRIGAMVAPFLAATHGSEDTWFALLILGTVPVIGAFLVCLIPETNRKILPNTIEEVEEGSLVKKSDKSPGCEESKVEVFTKVCVTNYGTESTQL